MRLTGPFGCSLLCDSCGAIIEPGEFIREEPYMSVRKFNHVKCPPPRMPELPTPHTCSKCNQTIMTGQLLVWGGPTEWANAGANSPDQPKFHHVTCPEKPTGQTGLFTESTERQKLREEIKARHREQDKQAERDFLLGPNAPENLRAERDRKAAQHREDLNRIHNRERGDIHNL